MLTIDDAAVRGVLRMDALIPAVARALQSLSDGTAVQPLRTAIAVPSATDRGFMWTMPALLGAHLGAKLVTYFPHGRGEHTHHAIIVLFDAQTGEPRATMDARLITEMRTAAVSAAATNVLARPDTSVLAIVGAGVQARSHLEGMRVVRPFSEVRVYSPRSGETFARTHGIVHSPTAEAAVRGADVVVVATSATRPVLLGEWLTPGMHINAVGAARPEWRELDDAAVRRAHVFVESRDAARAESGDVRAATGATTEIGEVIAGRATGRESADDITLFKSVGVAVADIATAAIVYNALRG